MNDLFDFSGLNEAMKGLQNAYSDGLNAMSEAGRQAAEDMEPSHRIIVEVKLSANVEGHAYKVDSHLEFLADLNSLLESQEGDIMALLGELNARLSEEEKTQVAGQLGKPRCIAVVDTIDTKILELHSEEGPEEAELNKEGTMLITMNGKQLSFSFESVLSFPTLAANKTLYFAMPSMEKMEKNITLPIDKLDQEIDFTWSEKDKDNLKIEGKLKLKTCP